MLSLFILFVVIIFEAEAWGPDNEPVKITFNISARVKESGVHITCDQNEDLLSNNKYTVLEGEVFHIYTLYDSDIHYLICKDDMNENVFNAHMNKSGSKDIITFMAEGRMGGIWNCTVLVHPDHPTTFPKVQYKDVNYTAAYCYMQIHVRLRESPQTILVNNMLLQTVRTDLSEDVDFTAEYQYADGDIVNVTCVDLLNPDDAKLRMTYETKSTMSDGSTSVSEMLNIFPYRVVGYIANLHSEHNNSFIRCEMESSHDFTDVRVRFVMRTEFSIITVRINGMAVRPVRPRKFYENMYTIDYIYERLHPINVVCEVQQTDMRLTVKDLFISGHNYSKTELIPSKKAEMLYYPNGTSVPLGCAASNYITGASAESIQIFFSAGNFPLSEYSLHITSSNGRSMDSYGQYRFIYYEYNDGETLQIQCGPLLPHSTTPYNVSLHLGDSDACRSNGCVLSKQIKVSRLDHNTQIVCYLKKEQIGVYWAKTKLSEIKVILRARLETTNSTTTATSTTTTSPVTGLTTATTTTSTAADPASSSTSSSNTLAYWLSGVGGGLVVLILIIVLYLLHKKRCLCLITTSRALAPTPTPTPTPRPHPANTYYENLLVVFKPVNEREAMELAQNHYEVVE